MASCERHEPSFVRKSLSALPGILLLTGVAVFSWFITPRLIALHPFMKSLNLSDFIVAIILGMVYNFLPFMVLPIYNVLCKIDDNTINAARDLGSSRPARKPSSSFPSFCSPPPSS